MRACKLSHVVCEKAPPGLAMSLRKVAGAEPQRGCRAADRASGLGVVGQMPRMEASASARYPELHAWGSFRATIASHFDLTARNCALP